MRYLLALAPLALLAACGGNKAAGNNTAKAAATTNNSAAAAPVAPPVTMAPAAPAATNDPRRAGMLAECSEAMVKGVPAGADVAGLCNCAVDRVIANREGEEQATMACAGQLGIAVDPTKM